MALFKTTISKDTVPISGSTVESTRALGSTIRWRAKANSSGLMAVATKGTIRTIRRRALGFLRGLMVVDTRVSG